MKFVSSFFFLSLIFFSSGSIVLAEDFKSPHKLKSGDVISADVINELFETIDSVNRTMMPTDILGQWSCEATYDTGNIQATYGNDNTNTILGSDGLTQSRVDILTFVSDGDGTYSWSSSNYAPFDRQFAGAQSGRFTIRNNIIFITQDSSDPNFQDHSVIRMISSTRFLIEDTHSNDVVSMVCDLVDTPPGIPESLSSALSNLQVTLEWIDKSSDETGFSIVRRDTLTGHYAEVGTSASNTSSYLDTVPASGTYWYRVMSQNANGKSLGSNVVKIVVP